MYNSVAGLISNNWIIHLCSFNRIDVISVFFFSWHFSYKRLCGCRSVKFVNHMCFFDWGGREGNYILLPEIITDTNDMNPTERFIYADMLIDTHTQLHKILCIDHGSIIGNSSWYFLSVKTGHAGWHGRLKYECIMQPITSLAVTPVIAINTVSMFRFLHSLTIV